MRGPRRKRNWKLKAMDEEQGMKEDGKSWLMPHM